MLVKMLGPKSSRRAWIHSPNTSGSSTILFVTTAPSDQAKFTTAILGRSTTHRRSGLFTYLSKMPQYNLLEAGARVETERFTHRFGSDLTDVVNC